MKILLIMPWIKQGGAELIATQTAYQLQKLDHQVRLVALFVDTSQMGKETQAIKYVTFGPKIANLFKKNKLFLYFFGPFFLFWLVLKETKWTEVLFPHSLPAYWIASVVGKLYRKRVVWLCNEPPKRKRLTEVGFADWLMWFMADSFLDRLFVQGIERIIVYSKGIAWEVKKRYGREATVIRLGIDFEFFAKSDKEKTLELKRKYHLTGRFVLLMVGKLHPQKNQRLGVEVLAKILPQIENAILVLVGEGPERKNLEFRISSFQLEEKVIFAGFCPPGIVRAWYAVSDLVLFPSVGQTAMVSQSWGFIPFEALCQKKLSVVSLNSGAAEVIGSQKIGFVSPVTTVGFAQAVVEYFKNREKYQLWAEKGKTWVKESLSWERFGQKVEKNLKKLVKN